MRLKTKLFLPIFIAVFSLGIIGIWLIHNQLVEFESQVLQNAAEEKSREVTGTVATLATQGLEKASLFSARKDVIKALELAHLGNINDESDPLCQQAREELRHILQDDLTGFKNVSASPCNFIST